MKRFVRIVEDDERLAYEPIDDETGDTLGCKFYYRRVPAKVRREITKKNTRQIRDKRTGLVSEVTDQDQVAADMLTYAVLGWEGIVNQNDEPVVFDKATLFKLPEFLLAKLIPVVTGQQEGSTAEALGN